MLLPEKDSAFYNTQWQIQRDKHGVGLSKYNLRYSSLHKVLARYLNPDDVVLEVACGPGHFAYKYIHPICKDFMATDFSTAVIDIAKEAYPEIADKFEVRGAFMKTEFPYNTIVALEFLEHIDKDRRFLRQIKPGTKVIFSVPLNEKEKPGMPGVPRGYPSHRRIYSREVLVRRYKHLIDFESIRRVKRKYARWAAVKGYRK